MRNVEKNILVAFLLNIAFSIIEFIGGILTNSIAIMSDAVHDFGDSLSIGISFILERISRKRHDNKYTFGYRRYSVLGAFVTTLIIIISAIFIINNSIARLTNPVEVDHDGMIIIAVIGIFVNMLAAYFTKKGDSLNQRAVNLHMIEDSLGWVAVLLGSIIIKYTKLYIIDSIMSILISVFLIFEALKNLRSALDLVLEKVPANYNITDIRHELEKIPGVENVHHMHVWSLDGEKIMATMHVVSNKNIKHDVREKLNELGIKDVTIEVEKTNEKCENYNHD